MFLSTGGHDIELLPGDPSHSQRPCTTDVDSWTTQALDETDSDYDFLFVNADGDSLLDDSDSDWILDKLQFYHNVIQLLLDHGGHD